jgi:hypothetical protein
LDNEGHLRWKERHTGSGDFGADEDTTQKLADGSNCTGLPEGERLGRDGGGERVGDLRAKGEGRKEKRRSRHESSANFDATAQKTLGKLTSLAPMLNASRAAKMTPCWVEERQAVEDDERRDERGSSSIRERRRQGNRASASSPDHQVGQKRAGGTRRGRRGGERMGRTKAKSQSHWCWIGILNVYWGCV